MIVGVDQYLDFPKLIQENKGAITDPIIPKPIQELDHIIKVRTCAYITIMRGCNNFCSYCIVPYMWKRKKFAC